MTLRDCMLYAGIRTSRRFAELSWFHRDFFYGLLHAAWPAGRFEADVEVLRAALYAPLLKRVSQRDVQGALVRCHELGLVKLWTDESGRGWGEVVNYRQHGLKKRQRSDAEPPPTTAGPPDEGPELFTRPGPPISEEGMKEGGDARNAKRPPPPTPAAEHGRIAETQSAWLDRLQEQHRGIDIVKELHAAMKNRRLQNKQLERAWFERHWLTNISETVDFATATARPVVVEPEPEAWRSFLKDEYENEDWAKSAALYEWAEMPANFRNKIAREMRSAS